MSTEKVFFVITRLFPHCMCWIQCSNDCHSNHYHSNMAWLVRTPEVRLSLHSWYISWVWTLHHPRQACLCRRVVMATILFMICIAYIFLFTTDQSLKFWVCVYLIENVFCALLMSYYVHMITQGWSTQSLWVITVGHHPHLSTLFLLIITVLVI